MKLKLAWMVLLIPLIAHSPHPPPVIPMRWVDQNSQNCLAQNLFWEARGEPLEGQVLVVWTVLNRSKMSGSSVCKEVYRPHQYSWTTRGVIDGHYPKQLKLVQQMISNQLGVSKNTDVTHYHNKNITPYWAKDLDYTTTVGNHHFYKIP